MGAKGDRASKFPQAERLYADGRNLAEISRLLDVSETTLRRWKADSLVAGPSAGSGTGTGSGDGMDGWDRARAQKRGNIARLRDLFERQLEYVEGLQPADVSPPMMDTLSKLGALVERWDKVESVIRAKAKAEAAEAVESEARRQGASATTIDSLRAAIMQELRA